MRFSVYVYILCALIGVSYCHNIGFRYDNNTTCFANGKCLNNQEVQQLQSDDAIDDITSEAGGSESTITEAPPVTEDLSVQAIQNSTLAHKLLNEGKKTIAETNDMTGEIVPTSESSATLSWDMSVKGIQSSIQLKNETTENNNTSGDGWDPLHKQTKTSTTIIKTLKGTIKPHVMMETTSEFETTTTEYTLPEEKTTNAISTPSLEITAYTERNGSTTESTNTSFVTDKIPDEKISDVDSATPGNKNSIQPTLIPGTRNTLYQYNIYEYGIIWIFILSVSAILLRKLYLWIKKRRQLRTSDVPLNTIKVNCTIAE